MRHELWYPFICEFAGLVDQQKRIYVLHQFLLIDSGNTIMPSTAFSGGFAWLAGAAVGHEYQRQQNNN